MLQQLVALLAKREYLSYVLAVGMHFPGKLHVPNTNVPHCALEKVAALRCAGDKTATIGYPSCTSVD